MNDNGFKHPNFNNQILKKCLNKPIVLVKIIDIKTCEQDNHFFLIEIQIICYKKTNKTAQSACFVCIF